MTRRRKKRKIAQMTDLERAFSRGAIPADQSQQAPNNSYDPPRYYEDVEFTCQDCGAEEVWTAAQQKWYFEVAKGTIYGQAIRCGECRAKLRNAKAIQRQQMEEAEHRRANEAQ